MIETEDIKDIDLKHLDKEIEKQLNEAENNKRKISICNKILIAHPTILIIVYFLVCICSINKFDSLASFIFESSKLGFIEAIILGSSATFTSILKNNIKKKNKILIENLNDNLLIADYNELDINKSIEVTVVEINEEILSTIKEIDLPEISIPNRNNKSKPKTRTLKKDNNNVRK